MIQGKVVTDFFISYTQVDRPWAEWIAWQLEEAGYTTVLQAWDFRPGSNFVLEMQRATVEAKRTIAVLSPDYLAAQFTQPEWMAAFTQDPTGAKGVLLPVRVQKCDPQGMLSSLVYIDLVGLEAEAARERLLEDVLPQRAKPTREPGFPGQRLRPVTEPPLFPGSIPHNIAQVGSASKFRRKIEEFVEEYLITETGLPTVPFGGRNEDIALLDAWLDNEIAPPRYLLTAPAGRGKSALLVRWLQHLQEQGRVGRAVPTSWQLVFVPISIRFETHRPDIFYEALAARLAEILGQELPPTHTDKGVYYADHCRTLASAAVAEGWRILIILDGIDEALGERFDARWFPRNPGTKLRLVLSARWQAGDLDSLGWQTRLRWDRDVRVQSRELPVLAREGVQDLLCTMGAPTDVLASRLDLVDRLYDLAEGEPLVLRYYAEDIWGMGAAAPRLTLDDLAQMRPGLGPYFGSRPLLVMSGEV
jgi:TIR domain